MGKEGEDMETTVQCARKRIEKELEDIYANPPTNISFGPISDDIFNCQGIIIGPLGTSVEGCTFNLAIQFPIDYPFKPPKVQFQTKVCHPNISANGTVDINILGDQWSSALTTVGLLDSISSILQDPIVQDSQNPFSDLHGHDLNSREEEARGWKHKLLRCWSRMKLFLIRAKSYSCKHGRREMVAICPSLKIHEQK